jgi:glycosyltransferase involved in cell wall biosynthesis
LGGFVDDRADAGDPIGVLMLAKGLGRGGTERLLHGTVRHLDRARFRVEVAYLLPWKDAFVTDIEADGVPVHCLEAPRPASLGWTRRLRRLVDDRGFDLVHTHMPLTAAAARLALPGATPVFVHTEHNLWDRYRPPTRWANRLTYGRNAAVIAVSESVARSIRSRRAPVEVVTHGADLAGVRRGAAARATARDELGLSADDVVVGTVANFTVKKDQATLLRAMAALGRDRPTVRLVLVGSGPLEAELRHRAADLGLAGRAAFVGSRHDVLELLPAFDVFALSSRFEGLPIALLEAMAAGLPCVATNVGGIPEVVTDGRDGLLVEPGDPDALATALGKVLADDGLRAELGWRAAARSEDFQLSAAVRHIERIYVRALG